MDLSQALDRTRYGLPTPTLYVYDFNKDLLQVPHSYLSNRRHRTKVNKQFSSWKDFI